MSTRSVPRIIAYLQVWSRIAAVGSVVVGSAAIAGAALPGSALSRISYGNAGTGIAFVLAGAALWFLRDIDANAKNAVQYILPLLVLIYALLSLAHVSL